MSNLPFPTEAKNSLTDFMLMIYGDLCWNMEFRECFAMELILSWKLFYDVISKAARWNRHEGKTIFIYIIICTMLYLDQNCTNIIDKDISYVNIFYLYMKFVVIFWSLLISGAG